MIRAISPEASGNVISARCGHAETSRLDGGTSFVLDRRSATIASSMSASYWSSNDSMRKSARFRLHVMFESTVFIVIIFVLVAIPSCSISLSLITSLSLPQSNKAKIVFVAPVFTSLTRTGTMGRMASSPAAIVLASIAASHAVSPAVMIGG